MVACEWVLIFVCSSPLVSTIPESMDQNVVAEENEADMEQGLPACRLSEPLTTGAELSQVEDSAGQDVTVSQLPFCLLSDLQTLKFLSN